MRQDPEIIVQRLVALLRDADESGVHLHGTVNFALPEYVASWYDGKEVQRRTVRRSSRTADGEWRVMR